MSEPTKPLRIFLSYAHLDAVSVRPLYDYLCDKGFDVRFDEESLTPGADWRLETEQGLSNADIVIVCLSQASFNKAGFIQWEIRFALDRALEMPEGHTFLIPLRLDDCRVPPRLARYQWLDLFESDGYQRLGEALKQRIEQLQQGVIKLPTTEIIVEDNPPLSWPQRIVSAINERTAGWSIFHSLYALGWIWLWLFTFWLVIPSLTWPFASQEQVFSALVMYTAGSLSIPPLIGLLTNTRNDKFWQERFSANDLTIRLYIHQGSGIGFHLSYFAAFMVNIVLYYLGYYLGLPTNPFLQRLLGAVEISALLVIGYACARLVPDNLWRAYKRLALTDGAIFFIFIVVGPFWAFGITAQPS